MIAAMRGGRHMRLAVMLSGHRCSVIVCSGGDSHLRGGQVDRRTEKHCR
ncbi:hypothetical protein [Massilia eurypsychrophila]|jgi:hypothetical protein|nr:hypothetical protein [Massilia eurypsychrophila]